MHPTQVLRSGGDRPMGRHGIYLNHVSWGNFGSAIKTRGIITYMLSSNRQNPLAGAAHAAVFNSWRRFAAQVLYWAPPAAGAWWALNWAVKRNEYLNSKAGRAEFAGVE
ncbi:hypothetical protein JX265_001710 [Neoarthrinium moseri]|uniref:Cytochrome b-c1 complex subunit 8 n=1 Tax=Neoarthrinium moseri TaxID=1658444 RepID=A0A9P9WVK0_9PEZI|nr:hypothetical protein JX265_001710 [Neoarthrinium moseri]